MQSPSSRRRRSSGTPKNPGVAIVLSFFFFGLGQLYNGQIGKGIFIMFLAFIFALLIWVVIGIFLLPVLYFWQLYDAYQSAEDYNRKHRF
ncbi:MAG: hypothetical protein COA78_12890 [Blastopirellula sp.]|nr:MAG: hypothetical protein COA78_12890 [Blastopirellula sp.]